LEKQSAIWQEFTRSLGKGPHASDSLRSTWDIIITIHKSKI
jgi:hypothetical protein